MKSNISSLKVRKTRSRNIMSKLLWSLLIVFLSVECTFCTLCKHVECKGDNEYYPEGDCRQCFCLCEHGNGIAHEICCPLGWVFNSITNLCDRPYNVIGC